jgi:hypothetical protein
LLSGTIWTYIWSNRCYLRNRRGRVNSRFCVSSKNLANRASIGTIVAYCFDVQSGNHGWHDAIPGIGRRSRKGGMHLRVADNWYDTQEKRNFTAGPSSGSMKGELSHGWTRFGVNQVQLLRIVSPTWTANSFGWNAIDAFFV